MAAHLPLVEAQDVLPVEEDLDVAPEAPAEVGLQLVMEPGDHRRHGIAR